MNLVATISIYAGGPGSGCRGENCGRTVTMYHGTIEKFIPRILKNGLDPRKSVRGEHRGAYLSALRKTARYYAKGGAFISKEVHHKPSKAVILHLEIPEKEFKKLKKDEASAFRSKSFYSRKRIPPEYIKRVERVPGFGFPRIREKYIIR